MNFWNGLPTRQKILAVVFLFTLVLAGVSLYLPSEELTTGNRPVGSSGSLQPKESIPPLAAKSAQPQAFAAVLRDPFSVPQGYGTAVPAPQYPQSGDPSYSSNSSNYAPAPTFDTTGTFTGGNVGSTLKLTGVVGAGSNRAIIIRSGSASRSYHINDQVGSYEIVSIGDRSVTLEGETGQKVLRLGE